MLPITTLKKFGLYIDEHFVSKEACIELCNEMELSNKQAGNVFSEENKSEYKDTALRKTQTCELSNESQQFIANKILNIKPALESFFNEQYATAWEEPKFLEYKKGDYFLPHTDEQAHRKLNISIYLNSQTVEPSNTNYTGGELKIYNLIQSPNWKNRGFSIPGIQGMLIAYPANLVHEVTAVETGYRYAIVSRFLDKASER